VRAAFLSYFADRVVVVRRETANLLRFCFLIEVFRPGRGSPSATNVVLLVVISTNVFFYFTTDCRQISHTDW